MRLGQCGGQSWGQRLSEGQEGFHRLMVQLQGAVLETVAGNCSLYLDLFLVFFYLQGSSYI